MMAQLRTRQRWLTPTRWLLGCVVLFGMSSATALAALPAEIPARPSTVGTLIPVPLPIAGNVDNRIKGMIQRAVSRLERQDARPVIVLEFSPPVGESQGSDFTRAVALATFLISPQLASVKTVAYVPRTVKGHAVLVAMACDEIVMTAEAELGEAGLDEPAEQPISPVVRSGYRQIADRRRTIPVPLALGMLDKRLEVLKVETDIGIEYLLRDDLAALAERRTIESEAVLSPAGELARLSGREGRDLGFVKYLAADRNALARELGLPADALREDPSLGGAWRPIRVKLEGKVNPASASQLRSLIDTQLRTEDVNFVLLEIDSAGGSLSDSMVLANYLAGLDRGRVRTVAYVPKQARGDASLVALACDHLVMRPEAILGGLEKDGLAEDEIAAARESIRESLAPLKSRSWSTVAALTDPSLAVFRFEHQRTGQVAYFSDQERDEQPEPERWTRGAEITQPEVALELDGAKAKQFGLAWETVEQFAELRQLYGLKQDPRLVEVGWAEFLIRALARPEIAMLLLVLGGVAIYAELQMPGIGIGGFVACVCFMLFFWSKALYGTAGWLEVMLFLGGFCFLLLEIFILPGFGIFGLGGGMMIVASLILASQTFILPHNATQLGELRNSLIVVGAAGVGIIALGMVMRHYLPHAPLFNRILLQPPTPEDRSAQADDGQHDDWSHLLGKTGVTSTQLTPGGKARFGSELVNVLTGGEVIPPDTTVVVVQARGNRVIVQTNEPESA